MSTETKTDRDLRVLAEQVTMGDLVAGDEIWENEDWHRVEKVVPTEVEVFIVGQSGADFGGEVSVPVVRRLRGHGPSESLGRTA